MKSKEQTIYQAFIAAYEKQDWICFSEQIKITYSLYIADHRKPSQLMQRIEGLANTLEAYPTGPERKHWNIEALEKLDRELQAIIEPEAKQLIDQRAELKKIIGL